MEFAAPTSRLGRDLLVLCTLACSLLAVHLWMGDGYGFHRDELQVLDDARHLQWGFVAYPPLTSFFGRIAIAIFGISPSSLRLPAAIANAISLVLGGLMARELGGGRAAQVLAMALNLIAALAFSSVLQYNTFDLLAWNIVVLSVAHILRTGDERWWLGAGLGIGVGILSKYSIAFPVASLFAALLLLPSERHHLRSRWLWFGMLLAAIVASPNLIWLARHQFVTLRMEHFIHLRDVRMGRAKGFFSDQLRFTLFGSLFAVAGLVALLRSDRFRLLAAFYLGPLLLFILAKGRGYYLVPAYPILYAAGAVTLERSLARYPRWQRMAAGTIVGTAVLLDACVVAFIYLPVWPVGSPAWVWQMKNNEDIANEVGWPEFTAQVAAVRNSLPAADRSRLALLADNYGEAGALELYGPRFGLPMPISTTNSFYDRGFGPYEPQTVIVVGSTLADENRNFQNCRVAALFHMPNGVQNEETPDYPQILVCHNLREPWSRGLGPLPPLRLKLIHALTTLWFR